MAVITYESNLMENILSLQHDLQASTWKPKGFREFIIKEPKERKVSAPDIESRIVHHAWCNICEPLFDRKFIDRSYACRYGMGMHLACTDLQKALRTLPKDGEWFAMKIDFRKYFHSIPHKTIKDAVRRTIRDPWAIWLIDTIIDSYPQGLPIGSLTSQLLANVVLDRIDQYVTCNLGVKRYGRYMDDIYILGDDRNAMENILEIITDFASKKLGLEINSTKSFVCCIKPQGHRPSPFDFCGYRVLPYKLIPRKSTVKRASKRIKKVVWRMENGFASPDTLRSQLCSYHGYTLHASMDKYARYVQETVILPASIALP
jgi:retron-type reverse transcriptase